MKTISKRLQTLERLLAPRLEKGDHLGNMADMRKDLLHLAEQSGESHAFQIRMELDALGPVGLWCQTVRGLLADRGFVQTGEESLAETMARALNIGTDELRIRIAQGRIGSALLERFGEVR